MDKSKLFKHLSTQETAILLELLSKAYDQMEHNQRRWVFGKLVNSLPPEPTAPVIKRDNLQSFSDQVYPTVLRVANKAQQE